MSIDLLNHFDFRDGNLQITLPTARDLRSHAWWVLDLKELKAPAPLRVNNRTRPRVAGVRPYKPYRNSRDISLPMMFISDVDRTGADTTDPYEALLATTDWFVDNICNSPDIALGKSHLLWTRPGLTDKEGDAQITGLTLGEESFSAFGMNCRPTITLLATLEVTLLDGRLA